MQIRFDKHFKYLESPNYNYKFDLRTGTFYEWGATKEENPTGCPFGPTILDIEITTICNGPTCSIPGSELFGKTIPCNFCYKSNGPVGTNMSFETFKKILDKMPKDSNGHHVLTQVAIGGSACAETNPDLWKMMEYCRENKVIPNITVADINPETAEKLVGVCGAVAVSAYKHAGFDTCFNTIDLLTNQAFEKLNVNRGAFEQTFGVKSRNMFKRVGGFQINIHYVISESSADDAYTIMEALKNDPRLKYVSALVFLHLKQKGRGVGHSVISQDKYDAILNYAFDKGIDLGFDTCGACRFLGYIDRIKPEMKDDLKNCIEYCCAGRFSSYVNEHGRFFLCSFMEHTEGWETGISVVDSSDFLTDIWNNEKVKTFACNGLKSVSESRGCQYYNV